MSDTKHTPGPWCWNLNLASKCIELESLGRPAMMRETVLRPRRWGMNSATIDFYDDGLLRPASNFATPVEGREHHAHWMMDVTHPDAVLIAAAPELLAACEAALQFAAESDEDMGANHWPEMRDAVAKAKGSDA